MHVTPAARSELIRFLTATHATHPATDLRADPGLDALTIRLQVIAGGCSGWSYHLEADPSAIEGDRVLQFEPLEIRIDPKSWPALESLSLDYSEDLMGGSFLFANPDAAQVCSCGNSFAIAEPKPLASAGYGI